MNVNDNCVGCSACYNICPVKAIDMVQSNGFFRAQIDTNKCINCNACHKACILENKPSTTQNDVFAAINNNTMVRTQSSSGGIFTALCEHIIANNGVVFGAVFTETFDVEISYTETDPTLFQGSKYVQASVGNSFAQCKQFLDAGRMVLFSGTPCQIYGLKSFLRKPYLNLTTVDVICHGAPSPTVWREYLSRFEKPIDNIIFRNKTNATWERWNFTVKFTDGTTFSEPYANNEYMQRFLSNEILNDNCYNCKFRANSAADITLGDLWGCNTLGYVQNDHKGISSISIHTDNGKNMIDTIRKALTLTKIPNNFNDIHNCNKLSYPKPDTRKNCIRRSIHPNIAIVTDQMACNVGGILQAYALQEKIKTLRPESHVEFINQWPYGHAKFYTEHINGVTTGFSTKYDLVVVGSDQIWNKQLCPLVPFADKYCIHNTKHIVYAASFGNHDFKYTNHEILAIHSALSKVKYISTREASGGFLTKNWFGIESTPVVDPTMLWDKYFYLRACHLPETLNSNNGIFRYVLDETSTINELCTAIEHVKQTNTLKFDGSVENFIYNVATAKYIVTDSYHGTVFALLFNKPFITIINEHRGSDRFEDLQIRFCHEARFISSYSQLDMALLDIAPNCVDLIKYYARSAEQFLKSGLHQI